MAVGDDGMTGVNVSSLPPFIRSSDFGFASFSRFFIASQNSGGGFSDGGRWHALWKLLLDSMRASDISTFDDGGGGDH